MDFTTKSFDDSLRGKWRAAGVKVDDGERVGVSVDELVRHSSKRNGELNDPYFDLWIGIYDEFVSWLISLASVTNWQNCKLPYSPTEFEKCIVLLLMRIISDSLAMRQLMTLGFDATAQNTVRSISEHLELLVAIIDDPELAIEFEKTRNPQAANQFWKRHISRNKIRPRLQQVWAKFFRGDAKAARWFANWGSRGYSNLSAISHPSFLGCTHAVITAKSKYDDENWLGMWGDRSLTSIFTVETYISYLFPVILAIGDFPFNKASAKFARVRRFNSTNELHKHIRAGRSVLGSLVMSLQTENNRRIIYPEIAEL